MSGFPVAAGENPQKGRVQYTALIELGTHWGGSASPTAMCLITGKDRRTNDPGRSTW